MSNTKTSHLFIDDTLPSSQAKQRYKKRRETLLTQVNAPILLVGITHSPNHTHVWSSLNSYIYQEPSLLYYTGINQIRTALLLIPGHPHTLFIDEKNPKKEFWEGLHLGYGTQESEAEITEITGISSIKPFDELALTIQSFLQETTPKTIYTLWHTDAKNKAIKDSNYLTKTQLTRWIKTSSPTTTLQNISLIMWPQRLNLDETDIQNMITANQMTATAFKNTLSHLPKMTSETQISARINYEIATQSHFGNSFPSIVASGQNATILHYTQNNAPTDKANLLLLDFGTRFQSINADISRTVPLSGKFNPLQKALYNFVLQTQKEVEANAKPGTTFKDLNQLAWATLHQRVSNFITNHSGKMTLSYDAQPHNIGHFLGLQVHDGDPSRKYRNTPFVPGNCITSEPGLYGHFTATIDGQKYNEWIGIRIEDNLLITPTGCQNLSTSCPKEIDELEGLIS